MLCLVIKLQLRKKLVHLILLGSLHNVIIYLFSVSFDSSFVTYHKFKLLRKDFFGKDFCPYLMYSFLSFKSVPHVISCFFHVKHEFDCVTALLSRGIYNKFDSELRCRKLRSILVISKILV